MIICMIIITAISTKIDMFLLHLILNHIYLFAVIVDYNIYEAQCSEILEHFHAKLQSHSIYLIDGGDDTERDIRRKYGGIAAVKVFRYTSVCIGIPSTALFPTPSRPSTENAVRYNLGTDTLRGVEKEDITEAWRHRIYDTNDAP